MARAFDGKVAFITGASSGIGAAVAAEFARQGAKVALAARRAERLAQVCEKIEAMGGQALAVSCDVTQRASLDAAVARVVETYGKIDVAFANAGFGVMGQLVSLDTETYRRQFDTNFFGVLDTIYAVLPHIIKAKGQLAITGSIMGRLGFPRVSAYCASKFALCGLAESIYFELARKGVAVTLVNPGFVQSEIRSVDNLGAFHADRKDSAPEHLVVSAESAARGIVRAIAQRKFEALITRHAKAMGCVNRHFPGLVRSVRLLMLKRRLKAGAR